MVHEHDDTLHGWIGVDFDGTLAWYDTWVSPTHCGRPIESMVERVKCWLAAGREVRIFSARAWPIVEVITPDKCQFESYMSTDAGMKAVAAVEAIRAWSLQHIGQVLTITCVKDHAMVKLFDDRCVQVRKNTGELELQLALEALIGVGSPFL